ncbi:enoyl-CoA hydratase [Nonomuraea sp. WAC 01424]|uniref:enoyl-CoA hydratase/isomerase family protein n=1 Tax=Nonomuraea sp. WAC 01424 TaxID=2203200 RepID=UPI000F7B17F8|nr:enoyl-CoA hydratase-related protein [Nonomuraea sp. WAC 01424]RSN07700.1 enoyl-CoA hydratase [Nonomuraea sp. WAC 01424]
MAEFVSVEVADQIATIRLDRPKMNALNVQVQRELVEAALQVDADAETQAVILYGGERVFAAGVDVKEMADMSYADMSTHSRTLQACFTTVARIGKPVIAAVTGYALGGGCELDLCADFRVAGESAKLGQPEVLLGLIPGAGGTQRLPRLVGPARAKDLIFSGRHVPAAEALDIGLVDRVVPDEQVYTAALEWAATFVGGPSVALRAAKQAVDQGVEVDLDSGLEIERLQFAGLFATDDARIGMRAFAEKAKPKFTGR